jgi:hypothetical protein
MKISTFHFWMFLSVLITACSTNRNPADIKDEQKQAEETQIFEQQKADSITRATKVEENNKIVASFLRKYPSLLVIDSLDLSFTYQLQAGLESSSNLILLTDAEIIDIGKDGDNYFLIIVEYFSDLYIRAIIDEVSFYKFFPTPPVDQFDVSYCCVVLRVNKVKPIQLHLFKSIDGEDINVEIRPNESNVFYLEGELLELLIN